MNRTAFLFGLAVAALVLALIPLSSWPAQAQQICEPRSTMVARMTANYGEVPVARAITAVSTILEVLAAPGGVTWSIIITNDAGLSCMVAIGEGWQALAPPQGQPMRFLPVAHGTDWISTYFPGCCAERDCDLVSSSLVSHRPEDDSWDVMWGGRLKDSRDGRYWVCERPDHSIRCFFTPSAGT